MTGKTPILRDAIRSLLESQRREHDASTRAMRRSQRAARARAHFVASGLIRPKGAQ